MLLLRRSEKWEIGQQLGNCLLLVNGIFFPKAKKVMERKIDFVTIFSVIQVKIKVLSKLNKKEKSDRKKNKSW